MHDHTISPAPQGRSAGQALARGASSALAAALIHRPKVLILDEPSSALDPQGVLDVRRLLKELRADGTAILLSSHQLNEIALVSDRIAFLHEGRLLRFGRLDELLGSKGESDVVLQQFMPSAAFRNRWHESNELSTWRVPATQLQSFLEAAWAEGAELVSVTRAQGDLTTAFIECSTASRPHSALRHFACPRPHPPRRGYFPLSGED